MNTTNPDSRSSKKPKVTGGESAAYGNDQYLVNRLIGGHTSDWNRFISDYGPRVRKRVADVALAFGRGEDDSAINDATAEVFAALIAGQAAPLRAYRGRSSLMAYMAVLATRSATRNFARHRLVVRAGRMSESEPGAAQADQATRLVDAEQQQRFQRILDRLPPNQRSVATLFHLKGQSFAQISEKLEMPIEAVGTALRDAESRFRELIESDEA